MPLTKRARKSNPWNEKNSPGPDAGYRAYKYGKDPTAKKFKPILFNPKAVVTAGTSKPLVKVFEVERSLYRNMYGFDLGTGREYLVAKNIWAPAVRQVIRRANHRRRSGRIR